MSNTPDPRTQFWEQRYASSDFLFGAAPNTWLMQQAGVWVPGQRVLCVADGEGRNGVALARAGLQVDSFDPAPSAVAKAQALAAQAGVPLAAQVAGWQDFAWPTAHYDGVVAIFIQFATAAERVELFKAMVRSLKPGGHLLLLGYTPEQLQHGTGGPSDVTQLYTEALLREAFGGLEILSLRSFEDVLDEGSGHAGRSALVGLVARCPLGR